MKNAAVTSPALWLLLLVTLLPPALFLVTACQNPVTSGKETVYQISVNDPVNGKVNTDRETARAGETVTLSISPDEEHRIDSVRIIGVSGHNAVFEEYNGFYTFTMPAEDVAVIVVFMPVGLQKYEITINIMIDGIFTIIPEVSQFETWTVKLIAKPDPGKKYRPGSLKVRGKDSHDPVKTTPVKDPDSDPENDPDSEWTFEMPPEEVEVDAEFIDEETALYDICIVQPENGTIDCGQDTSVAGDTVTVAVSPKNDNYRYVAGSLAIEPDLELTGIGGPGGGTWTFAMPEETVTITAEFEEIPTYAVIPLAAENGSVVVEPSGRVRAGAELTVSLIVADPGNFRYKDGSLQAACNGDMLEISAGEGSLRWKFTMPDEEHAADVTLNAVFEEIPSYAVAVSDWGKNGAVTAAPLTDGRAREGALITVSLSVADTANYRYVIDSLSIAGTQGGTIHCKEAGELRWTFTMPAKDVTVKANIEFIPWFDIIMTQGENGNCTVTGVETTGPYAGKAREGYPITVSAVPNPGYKLADGALSVMPLGAVTVYRAEDQPAWTFDMPDSNLTIGVGFAELGLLEIYKGGARRGITVGELEDDKKYYADSVDAEAEEGGRNGNPRAIKISHAVNANGNTVQQSFGLFSDSEIDLDTVAALSFWAKANKQLNIRYAGFGDADPDKRVVYTGENFNQAIPIGTEWKRYVIPVPAHGGQKTTRPFFFNAQLSNGNYLYIDDIEFIKSGITVTEVSIPDTCELMLHGAVDAAKILKGLPVKLVYACDDGTMATLQCAVNSHTLKYNLTHWLTPFIDVNGSVNFTNGKIIPAVTGAVNAFALTISVAGTASNPMTANIVDGILLDDFEGWSGNIPANPAAASGYIWHTNASGSVLTRDYITAANDEIHSGLRSGSWRPSAAANNPRGGRNFETIDAAGYNTLVFRIRVTGGTSAGSNFQTGTVFAFELKNGGTLANKANGTFIKKEFIYNTEGWQLVTMNLSDFVEAGLDSAAITGYALSVLDNKGASLRISLDDIALVYY